MSEEKQVCSITMPTALDGKAASSAKNGKELCYRDIEIQVARGLGGEPEIRLKLKTEFVNEEYSSRNRPNNPAFQIFNPIGMVLGMAVLNQAFKDFHTLDEIFDFEPTLNDNARILEWANPMRALPAAFIDVLNVLKQQLVLPTSESPSQGPPASEDNSTIPTFRPFAAPLSPCLTPSALIEEGSEALGLSRAIHEDIKQGRYECLICNKYIRPVSHIWSCRICCRVLHLSCIKKWLEVELSLEELDTIEDWHCPACTDQIFEPPWNYNCWCGKQVEPHPLLGLPPHSCGQACSRVSVWLSSPGKSCCDRPCEFICHAGPCPPCGYQEPLQVISDQSSEDKSRHPRSKRTFGEMDESIITHSNDIGSTVNIADDDDNEPPLKKHKVAVINSLIKTTKAELTDACRAYKRTLEAGMADDRSMKSCNQLRRRRNCLADARRHILDREIEPTSGLHDTPLLAIHGLITENKGARRK